MSVYSCTTEGEETLTTSAETLLQITGSASIKTRVVQWSVAFDSTSATAEPVLVRLARQSTAGTATGAAEVTADSDDPAALVTCFHSFTAEPTIGAILEEHLVYPGGIPLIVQYPLGDEPVIDASTSDRLAIIVTAPAAVNAVASMRWREGG
jgi:hypothetical protein